MSRTEVARVGLGLMIRAGAPKPDVSSAEAFRKTLLGAEVDRLRAHRRQRDRVCRDDREDGDRRRHQGQGPAGRQRDEVNASILGGASDLAVLPVSEILPVKGAELGGVFPPAVQSFVVMTAGLRRQREESAAR